MHTWQQGVDTTHVYIYMNITINSTNHWWQGIHVNTHTYIHICWEWTRHNYISIHICREWTRHLYIYAYNDQRNKWLVTRDTCIYIYVHTHMCDIYICIYIYMHIHTGHVPAHVAAGSGCDTTLRCDQPRCPLRDPRPPREGHMWHYIWHDSNIYTHYTWHDSNIYIHCIWHEIHRWHYIWHVSYIHRKSSLYLPVGSVNLVLKVMGTPDEISSPPGWNRVSPGCPRNFNTELSEPTRQIKTAFPMDIYIYTYTYVTC